MSKGSVTETRTVGPPASETSSRQVQASSTSYSQRIPSRASPSPPSSPGPKALIDDHHLNMIGFGSTDGYLLDQAAPGRDALYLDDNQDRVNLKHALEDLSQEARRSANGDSHNNINGNGHTNGNHSNKRPKMEAPKKASPSKRIIPTSPRRNGRKDMATGAKARKTS